MSGTQDEREKRIAWLIENQFLWATLYVDPAQTRIDSEKAMNIKLKMILAGLYSPKTNLSDISLRTLIRDARARMKERRKEASHGNTNNEEARSR